MIEKLSIAWWNTSLSPKAELRKADTQRGIRGATVEERNIALQVILYLLQKENIDFLALGEMAKEDIEALQREPNLDDYKIESGIFKTGRITFDTCFIYSPDKVTIHNISDISKGRSGAKLKIAQKLILEIQGIQELFYLFVSHWASRLWCPENDADRHLLGARLCDEVDTILTDNSELIILMGDYNDEPFDDSLARQLQATRDKALIKHKTNLLYNPFWQHLTYSDNALNYAGTYYHKSGKETTWRTFDQIIVSSAFINSELQLNEAETGIVHTPHYLKQVKDGKTIFDHLPIKATFQRV